MGYSPASAIPLSSFGAPTANISMNTHKFTSLLDGTTALDSAGWDQLPGAGNQYAYVVSGCVWTADAPGSTLAASMSSGTVMIGGLLYTVAAVTSRTFTASVETYVDINLSGGATAITYTTVANWGISPALASSGTALNTIRVAVISSGSSSIAAAGVGTGSTTTVTIAGTQPSSTVAAGSNGQTIGSLTSNQLAVASGSTFVGAGGLLQIAHSGGTTYTIKYTGVSTNNLTGMTAANTFSGVGTVSTGDTVTGYCPIALADNIGNLIYPTTPFPRIIASMMNTNGDTTTLASTIFPLPRLITPFVIPPGPSRLVKLTIQFAFLSSSAVAGTNISVGMCPDNLTTYFVSAISKVPVASDGGINQFFAGVGRLAAGTYYGQANLNQGAAGTLSYGSVGGPNQLTVQLLG